MAPWAQRFLEAYEKALREYDGELGWPYAKPDELLEQEENQLWEKFLNQAKQVSCDYGLPIWLRVTSSAELEKRFKKMKHLFTGSVVPFALHRYPDEFAPANVYAFENTEDASTFKVAISDLTEAVCIL